MTGTISDTAKSFTTLFDICRISTRCTGLYSDANEAAMTRIIAAARTFGTTVIGFQLAHAGRKASSMSHGGARAGYRAETGGAYPALGPGRYDRLGAADVVQPALGLARGGGIGRLTRLPAPIWPRLTLLQPEFGAVSAWFSDFDLKAVAVIILVPLGNEV